MGVDYEVEYNNRARVPEHPEIFVRWQQDAAAYRAAPMGRSELGLSYGPTARQTIDLFHAPDDPDGPLALFIHGGYWRSLEPVTFSHMARGLNGNGVTVAVCGYDLCPQVSIGDIIDQTRQACLFLWRRFGKRIFVYGHSAGGHLAACQLATDWRQLMPDAPRDLVSAACAISGLFDLTPLVSVTMNEDLRLTQESARGASPLFWTAPAGLALDAWCGALESSEFRRQNRIITEVWGKAGVDTDWREIPDTNHFTVLDPLAHPDHALTRRLAELAVRTR